MIDCYQVNAYLIWKRNPINQRLDHRERAIFLQQLVAGLIEAQEEVHIPVQRLKRNYCGWRGC